MPGASLFVTYPVTEKLTVGFGTKAVGMFCASFWDADADQEFGL
ncbi:MAG: hypothetical protein WCS42_05585 [Verrucomicrobiota bacterium]